MKMKQIMCMIIVVLLSFLLCSCVCKHEWIEATCTEPKTCEKCGETEGESLGHQWKPATCTEAKTCSVCNTSEGEPLGHKWQDATCENPKTCSVCGITDGSALEHTPGKWESDEIDYVKAESYQSVKCVTCGKTLDSKTTFLDSLHAYGMFFLTPEDFAGRMSKQLRNNAGKDYSSYFITESSDAFGIALFYQEEYVGAMIFSDYTGASVTDEDCGTISSVVLGFTTNDQTVMAYIMLSAVRTVDPTLSFEEARDTVLKNCVNTSTVYNDIRYAFVTSQSKCYFSITLP